MSTPDVQFEALRRVQWHASAHRARLRRGLERELDRRAERWSWLRRWPAILGLTACLGSGAFAGVRWFQRWQVRTEVDGVDAGATAVEIDPNGNGLFTLPDQGLSPKHFEFDLGESEPLWVHFDIETVEGNAEVKVHEFDEYPIDPAQAQLAFERAEALARADAGELWGASLLGPILVVDPVTRFLVANRPVEEGFSKQVEEVYVARLPANLGCANTTIQWGATRWTMVLWPLPDDAVSQARLLLHESFHRAQVGLGFYEGGQPCAHLDDFDGRYWLRLESRALARALRALLGEESLAPDALADALLFRAQRRALLPDAAASEDALERLEGTAEYTGVTLSGADRAACIRHALDGLAGMKTRPTLGRSFAYLTGPAYGLLLDELHGAWRVPLAEDGSSFGDLAAVALAWEKPPAAGLSRLAAERATAYGGQQVEAEERARQATRDERLRELRARYVDGPVLRLPAATPNYTYDPNRVESLEGWGSVYGQLTLRDEWGSVVANRGALMGEGLQTWLPEPEDLEPPDLSGDGWSLMLAPGWQVVEGERLLEVTLKPPAENR